MPPTDDLAPGLAADPGASVAPLSSQQEHWCAGAQWGAFGPHFLVARALRVTGHVDVAALRAALDDVVVRHELLRTVIVCDADEPYQRIHPPCPVPLVVTDLPYAEEPARDRIAVDLLTQAERSSLPVEELPLLRAYLSRFDERDCVLGLVSHHTACDGWSLDLVTRDLAACYAARTGERPLALPPPVQYAEYARWQRDNAAGPAAAANLAYWRQRLAGARVFALPADRPVRRVHELPYSASPILIELEVVSAAARLAKSVRSSVFIVLLAAFNVLAHRVRGTLDPVINTIIHGRGQSRFKATVGPFLNFLALRTGLDGCASFHDVVRRTRDTCLDAYQHEVPIQEVERELPDLMAPLADPGNCDFIFGYAESPFHNEIAAGDERHPFRIAERSVGIRRPERVTEEMPGGAAWDMARVPAGEITGALRFNPEEFDESTVAGWVSDYGRILAAAVKDPDRDWRSL